jgi:hypothetical protein
MAQIKFNYGSSSESLPSTIQDGNVYVITGNEEKETDVFSGGLYADLEGQRYLLGSGVANTKDL